MAKYKSRRDRVHAALRLYHGIGCEEHSAEEIADELGVRRSTVDGYIYETQQAQEIEETLENLAEKTRRELIMDKRERLRSLHALEEELRDAVEAVVTDFSFEEVTLLAEDHPSDEFTVDPEHEVTFEGELPVPTEVKQVPQFDRLRKVWEEMRETEAELAGLLALEEEENVTIEGDVQHRKYYALGTDPEEAGFPEQEVEDLSEEESV